MVVKLYSLVLLLSCIIFGVEIIRGFYFAINKNIYYRLTHELTF